MNVNFEIEVQNEFNKTAIRFSCFLCISRPSIDAGPYGRENNETYGSTNVLLKLQQHSKER